MELGNLDLYAQELVSLWSVFLSGVWLWAETVEMPSRLGQKMMIFDEKMKVPESIQESWCEALSSGVCFLGALRVETWGSSTWRGLVHFWAL